MHLVKQIISYLASKQDPSLIKDSLQDIVEQFSKEDSIERPNYP